MRPNETYTAIGEVTGVSSATISRVKRCLNFGADGYQLILRRLQELDDQGKLTGEKESHNAKN